MIDTDDLIRDAVHELVAAAPDPKPLPTHSPTASPGSRRRLAVAASVVAIAVGGGAIALLSRDGGDRVRTAPATSDPTLTDDVDSVAASVVGVDPDPASARVEIDRGSNDGIRIGMAVVDTAGLVGVVIEVLPATSIVMLVSDPIFTTTAHAVTADGTQVGSNGLVVGAGADRLVQAGDAGWPGATAVEALTIASVTTTGDRTGVAGLPLARAVNRLPDGRIEFEPIADLDAVRTGGTVRVLLALPRVPAPTTEPTSEPTGESTPGVPEESSVDVDVPSLLSRSFGYLTLPADAFGDPWISSGVLENVVALDGRRMVWAREPSGAAFSYLSAWIENSDAREEGPAAWQRFDLATELEVGGDDQPLVGDWPADVASDGSMAVAVGADAFLDGDPEQLTVVSEPRVWITTDLLDWELIAIPGSGQLTQVARTTSGWAALGQIDGRVAVLQSTDGRSWTTTLSGPETDRVGDGSIARAGDRLLAAMPDATWHASDDGGSTWAEVAEPVDGTLCDAGGGASVVVGTDRWRVSIDGASWLDLAAPSAFDSLTEIAIGWASPCSGIAYLAELGELVVAGRSVWVTALPPRGPNWTERVITEGLPATEWGPSFISGVQALSDGTVVFLAAVPQQPGTKPAAELHVIVVSDLRGDPAERARDAVVAGLVELGYTDVGSLGDTDGLAAMTVETPNGAIVSAVFRTGLEMVGDDTDAVPLCEDNVVVEFTDTDTAVRDAFLPDLYQAARC